jgi:hypothetical protein
LFFSIFEAIAAVLPTLASLIECAGLDGFLTEEMGLTVSAKFLFIQNPCVSLRNIANTHYTSNHLSQLFAPSEEALAGTDVDALCADPETLTEILSYHVVPAVLPSTQIPSGKSYVKSAQGSSISLYLSKPGTDAASLMVDHAMVVSMDVGANNGMIHVIDSILTVPVASKGKSWTKSKSAYKGKGKGRRYEGKSSKSRR